jgi:hypothetical protein
MGAQIPARGARGKGFAVVFATVAAIAGLLLGSVPAAADTTTGTGNWVLGGTYTLNFTCVSGCSGVWSHTMTISSFDSATGAFTGTGFCNAYPENTWNVTGTVTGNSVTYTIVYTGANAGYTVNGTGTIAADGSLSGTATAPGQSFNWASSGGLAMWVVPALPVPAALSGPTSPDQCKNDGFKAFGFRNQGDCVASVVSQGRDNAASRHTVNQLRKEEKAAAEKAAAEKAAAEKAAAEKAAADKAAAEKAAAEKAAAQAAAQAKVRRPAVTAKPKVQTHKVAARKPAVRTQVARKPAPRKPVSHRAHR